MVSRLAGRVFGRARRSANLSVSHRILGEILKSNFAGIPSGPWHRVVKADWLGPYTPTLVRAWVLKLMRANPIHPSAHLGPLLGR